MLLFIYSSAIYCTLAIGHNRRPEDERFAAELLQSPDAAAELLQAPGAKQDAGDLPWTANCSEGAEPTISVSEWQLFLSPSSKWHSQTCTHRRGTGTDRTPGGLHSCRMNARARSRPTHAAMRWATMPRKALLFTFLVDEHVYLLAEPRDDHVGCFLRADRGS